MLVAACATLISVAAAVAQTETSETPAEKANVQIVESFCKTWGAADFDPDKVMKVYLADDSSIRAIQNLPPAIGPAAAAAAFKPYLVHGERYKVKFLSVYAKGPIVVTHRIDTTVTPGKPDQKAQVVGVFYLDKGKIKEWTDYAMM
jgi:limonene-1,2-epoxide hydrolase